MRPELKGQAGLGDAWVWVGLDADTKLTIGWLVGPRSYETAHAFVADWAARLATRVQLTTDANRMYLGAVESAFGWNGVDYAMLVKLFAELGNEGYSPPTCIGIEKTVDHGEAGGEGREYLLRRAAEHDHADAVAALHPINQRLLTRRWKTTSTPWPCTSSTTTGAAPTPP